MSYNIFENRRHLSKNKKTQVPVWFMRQAGRYHKHYQNIKKDSDFMTMCKDPDLAATITMGPIEDFNFDAAILFSDLLFPLEQLAMGLSYLSGPPTLNFHLDSISRLENLKVIAPAHQFYQFQKLAVEAIRKRLSPDKSLLGFVGSPFTLYTYAVEGAHSGNLLNAKKGLYSGLYQGFVEKLMPELQANIKIQASAGCDAVAVFDTAAGELSPHDFFEFVVPLLQKIADEFKREFPHKKLIYYSKNTNFAHLQTLKGVAIDVLGIDWRLDMSEALRSLGKDYYLQGNIDPCWLHLPWNQLEKNLRRYFHDLMINNLPLEKLIFGLGHGVLVGTPEENVRKSVELVHQLLNY